MLSLVTLFGFTLNGPDTPNVEINKESMTFRLPSQPTGNPTYSFSHPTGYYQIECYSGAGGSMSAGYQGIGGKGGYASGFAKLPAGNLTIYIGGKGATFVSSATPTAGGFNGGGEAWGAAGGGGYSAVELAGAWIIGAGGGGGANDYSTGGSAAGLVGGDGGLSPTHLNSAYLNNVGDVGGSQVAAGALGGSGHNGGGAPHVDGGGGGGGYYGGGMGKGAGAAGGAGSSYISGHPGCERHPAVAFTNPVFGTHDGDEGYVNLILLSVETKLSHRTSRYLLCAILLILA